MSFNKLNLLLALLLLAGSAAAATPAAVGEYEKTYSETFNVNNDGTVNLTNRYGRIEVETWEKDQVKIDVRLVVTADDEDDANRVFDKVRITFSKGPNTATAVTTIDGGNKSNKGWLRKLLDGDYFSYSSSSSRDYKVIYRVRMPAGADLNTDARYCDVTLPDLSGSVTVKVAYGKLGAGDLTGRCDLDGSYGAIRVGQLGNDSRLRVRYCDGNEVRRAQDLRYDGRYSETEFGTVGRVEIDAGYDEIEVRKATEIRFDGNYNSLEIGEVGRFFFDGNYSDLEVESVTEELEVDAAYGDVEVDALHENFRRVYVRVSYSDVNIRTGSLSGVDLELRTRYGDIGMPSDVRNVNRESSGSSRSVIGRVTGSKNRGRIDITTSYGDIELSR